MAGGACEPARLRLRHCGLRWGSLRLCSEDIGGNGRHTQLERYQTDRWRRSPAVEQDVRDSSSRTSVNVKGLVHHGRGRRVATAAIVSAGYPRIIDSIEIIRRARVASCWIRMLGEQSRQSFLPGRRWLRCEWDESTTDVRGIRQAWATHHPVPYPAMLLGASTASHPIEGEQVEGGAVRRCLGAVELQTSHHPASTSAAPSFVLLRTRPPPSSHVS